MEETTPKSPRYEEMSRLAQDIFKRIHDATLFANPEKTDIVVLSCYTHVLKDHKDQYESAASIAAIAGGVIYQIQSLAKEHKICNQMVLVTVDVMRDYLAEQLAERIAKHPENGHESN